MKHWLFSVILIQGLFLTEVLAQESLASSGGNGSSVNGTIDFTVGQVVYDVSTSSTGNMIKGIQQPFEIFIITNIKDLEGIEISMEVYPNPASKFLILEIKESNIENLSYRLYDINGKLISETAILNNQTFIQFEESKPSEYFLKVLKNNKELKSFRIVKN